MRVSGRRCKTSVFTTGRYGSLKIKLDLAVDFLSILGAVQARNRPVKRNDEWHSDRSLIILRYDVFVEVTTVRQLQGHSVIYRSLPAKPIFALRCRYNYISVVFGLVWFNNYRREQPGKFPAQTTALTHTLQTSRTINTRNEL